MKPLEDKLLTLSFVADYLQVDTSTVRRWIKHGAIEAITLPSIGTRPMYRIKESTLEKIINDNQTRRS